MSKYVRSPRAVTAVFSGLAKVREGANLEAIPDFERAIGLEPNGLFVHAELVETLLDVGEAKRAEAAFERFAQLASATAPERDMASLERSVRARIQERYSVACAERRVLLERYPDDLHLTLRLAGRLEESGSVEAARKLYEKTAIRSFAAELGLCRALVAAGEPSRALQRLGKHSSADLTALSLEARGMMHSIQGLAYFDIADFDSADRHLQQSLECRTLAGDRRGQAASLTNLASVYARVGRVEEARGVLEKALRLAREQQDPDYESYALGKIGLTYLQSGEPRPALDFFRKAVAIEWPRQIHSQLDGRLNAMAHAYAQLGLYEDAEITLQQAKTHLLQSRQADQEAYSLLLDGLIRCAHGDFADSDSSLERAAAGYEKAGLIHEAAWVDVSFARSCRERGQYRKAETLLERAVEALIACKDDLGLARAELGQASLLCAWNDLPGASGCLERVVERLDGRSFWSTGPRVHLVRGEIAMAQANLGGARDSFRLALDSAARAGLKELAATARIGLGRALTGLGDAEGALSAVGSALEIAASRRLRPLESTGWVALSHAQMSSNRPGPALEAASLAVGIAQELTPAHPVSS
jgi:tetratricopeptide (TPR) repeat protein